MAYFNPSWKEVLEKTDWTLLREQKEALLSVMSGTPEDNGITQDTIDSLDGILHFLDSVQDAAAEEIGEEAVFALKCPDCGSYMALQLIDEENTSLGKKFKCPEDDCSLSTQN